VCVHFAVHALDKCIDVLLELAKILDDFALNSRWQVWCAALLVVRLQTRNQGLRDDLLEGFQLFRSNHGF
jgi:hypothetical protein